MQVSQLSLLAAAASLRLTTQSSLTLHPGSHMSIAPLTMAFARLGTLNVLDTDLSTKPRSLPPSHDSKVMANAVAKMKAFLHDEHCSAETSMVVVTTLFSRVSLEWELVKKYLVSQSIAKVNRRK